MRRREYARAKPETNFLDSKLYNSSGVQWYNPGRRCFHFGSTEDWQLLFSLFHFHFSKAVISALFY